MDVVKTASFNDRCRLCGADIPDDGGCISDYICDDCCDSLGHAHPWSNSQTPSQSSPNVIPFRKKGSVMKKLQSYLTEFIPGLVGRFRRNPDGSTTCSGLALKGDQAAYVKLATEPEAQPANIALAPAQPPVRLGEDQHYLGSTVRGMPAIIDTHSDLSPAQEQFNRYAMAIADGEPPAAIDQTAVFVKRSCRICGSRFETTGERATCDAHAHRGN